MKRVFYLVLVFTVFVSSCSIKKRAYRRGYYVDWAFKKNNTKSAPIKDKQIEQKKTDEPAIEEIVSRQHNETNTDLASASKQIESVSLLQNKKLLIEKDSGCGDIITFRKGYELKAKVIEINETQIKYKPCENLNGPLVVINKNDVFSVKYPNGFIDVFTKSINTKSENEYSAETYTRHKVVPTIANVVLYCAVGSVLFLGPFAALAGVIIAPIARRKIEMNPDKYTGLRMVKIASTVCWAILILSIVLILLLIILIFGFI